MDILRMKLYNEMTVIGDDSLDPGPEPLEGLRHGVPVQGAHQRLHPLDLVLVFVGKLRDATHKIIQRVAIRRAGRPDLLPPHLREVLLMDLSWSLVISSSGLAARSVNMRLLRLLCPFCFY